MTYKEYVEDLINRYGMDGNVFNLGYGKPNLQAVRDYGITWDELETLVDLFNGNVHEHNPYASKGQLDKMKIKLQD